MNIGKKKNNYLDYSIGLLFVFSIYIDVLSTIKVLQLNGSELNPFYSYLIGLDINIFIFIRTLIIPLFIIYLIDKYDKKHFNLSIFLISIIWLIAGINNMYVLGLIS